MSVSRSKQEYVSIPEAARRIGMTRQGVYRWVKEKRVRGARRMLRDWRLPWPLVVLRRDRRRVWREYSDDGEVARQG